MSEQNLPVEIDRIQNFYQEYVHKHNSVAGWASRASAEEGYAAAASDPSQQWSIYQSVLDIGSGEGHFLNFLRSQREFTGQYVGLELFEIYHNTAVDLYGDDEQAEFIHDEFLTFDFGQQQFDWVVSIGGLGVQQSDKEAYDLAFCQKMISLAKYGISVFVNDIKQMTPGRLEQIPDLAAHDLDEAVAMLNSIGNFSRIEVLHYPLPTSQKTMINAIFAAG